MRYRDLKAERDAAIARAVEAERMSMKSEFDKLKAEFSEEREKLRTWRDEDCKEHYRRGFNDGLDTMKENIERALKRQPHISTSDVVEADDFSRPGAFKKAFDELLTESPEEAFCQQLYESGKRRAEKEKGIKT